MKRMKILAVDTALGACSAAILENEIVLAHRFEMMERGHAERVAPMVREVMVEAGVGFAGLDRLAVTTGPGTFTGQRVGLAFMRGLRIALKRPLVGVTTLEAMMAAALADTGLSAAAALHDARRGEVYCAAFRDGRVVMPPCVFAVADAISALRRLMGNCLFALAGTAAGDAVALYNAQGANARLSRITQPDAVWVARLALGATAPEGPPRPLYLRAPDARLPGVPG